MYVRSSTRATSPGSLRARYELGRLASESFSNVPASTSSWQSASYSSAEPSHQWIADACVSSATSSTQARSFLCLVGTVVSMVTWAFDLSWDIAGFARALQTFKETNDRFDASERQRAKTITPPGASLRQGYPEHHQTIGWGALRGFASDVQTSRLGTSTRRLNSATSVPSWFRTRVWTSTVPLSGLLREGFFSSTSVSAKRVSPWKTGAGWLSSWVARLAIALPEMSDTLMPSAS